MAANVEVVELAPRESFWARELRISRANNNPAVVEDLRAVRQPLMAHLRTQLPFWAKVSFKMTLVAHDPWNDEGEEDVMGAYGGYYLLQPAPWKVTPNADPDRRLERMVSVARQKLETHLERARFRGSRDIIGHIEKIYLLVAPAGEMARIPGPAVAADRPVGAKIHEMPEGLSCKRGLWNPQNEDHQCFHWCIRAHMAGVESWSGQARAKAAERLNDPRFFEPGYAPVRRRGRPCKDRQLLLNDFGLNFSCLPSDRGVVWSDMDRFEAANQGKIACYVWEWIKVDWGERKFFQREMVRGPTVEDAAIQVLLLRVENHYMLIYDFNVFCSNRSAELCASRRLTTQVFACHRCGGSFKSQETLLKHQEQPCSRDPARRATAIRMPDAEKNEHLLRYKTKSSAELAPLTLYADLETWSETAPNVQVQEHTHCLQRNVASAALLAVTHNGFELSQDDKCFLTHAEVGEHRFAVVERFLRKALRLAKDYVDWTKCTNIMPRPTEAQWRQHGAALRCQRCNCLFREDCSRRMKVCHHRHGTGEFIESLCATCNKGVRQPACVAVMFHNGGGYDFGFLLRAIAFLRGGGAAGQAVEATREDELLPEAEDVDAEVDFAKLRFEVLFKSGEKILQFQLGNLVFRDSMNFYKQSLGDLMSELKKTATDGDVSVVFQHVAMTHPDLSEERLTEERRRRLWRLFSPELPEEGWADCPLQQYKQWTWELLLRKLPMPFEHMSGPEVWARDPVWPRRCYDSMLDPPTVQAKQKKDQAYQLLVETAGAMGWQTFREMHDSYLFMDLALSDVMEAFRAAFFQRFRIDPLQYITLPGAAFDAMLFDCTKHHPLCLIKNEEVYRTVRRSIMGGLSCIFQPYAKANHTGLDDFDPQQPVSYVISLDINSMYPALMTQPLPCDSGTVVDLAESQEDRAAWLRELLDGVDFQAEDETECHLVVVDYDFPAEYHDELDWAPPARMKVESSMLGEHSQRVAEVNGCSTSAASEKLVPFLGLHTREGVDAKRLKFMVEVMHARIRKIHGAIRFRCSRSLARWMQMSYDERIRLKKQGRLIEAEMLKLIINSIYGKLIQNVEEYRSTGIHTSIRSWLQAADNHRMTDISQRRQHRGGVHRSRALRWRQSSIAEEPCAHGLAGVGALPSADDGQPLPGHQEALAHGARACHGHGQRHLPDLH